MKWSSYNFSFQRSDGSYVLFNGLTSTLLKLSKGEYEEFLILKKSPSLLDELEDGTKEFLLKAKIFANDEIERKIIQNERRLIKEQSEILDAWIYPTLGCNFRCPYCFQLPYEHNTMNQGTIENVVKYFELKLKQTMPKLLSLNWMGGEPLLVLDKIKHLHHRINELAKENGAEVEAFMITNGYLINEEFINKDIDELGLSRLQITIDGNKETHNRKRPAHGGKQTYDTIISNLKLLFSKRNDVFVDLRVNLEKDNKEEFVDIYKFFNSEFREKKLNVYAGFVDNYSLTCKSTSDTSCSLDHNDRAEFFIELFEKHNIVAADFLPTLQTQSCTAQHKSSFLIGPHGYIHKCTTTVGNNEMAIGNVNTNLGEVTNPKVLEDFYNISDYNKDSTCTSCSHYVTCDGGCPLLRLKENYTGEKYDTCAPHNGNLSDYLESHVKLKELLEQNSQ